MMKTLEFQRLIIEKREPVQTPPNVLEYVKETRRGFIIKARWETVEFLNLMNKFTKALHKEFMRQYKETIIFLDTQKAFEELYDYARKEHQRLYEKGKRKDMEVINRYFQGWDVNVKPEKMKEVMDFYLPRAAKIGGMRALRDLGVSLAFHLKDPKIIEAIQKRGAKITGQISKITLEKFRDTFYRMYMEEGMTPYDLRKRIKDMFRETYKHRAFTIARTECGIAQMEVQFKTYQKNGIKKKRWMAIIDERTRESHVRVNGEVQFMEDPFTNGLMYPLDDRGPAEEIINCRCDWTSWEVENIGEIRQNPWIGEEE